MLVLNLFEIICWLRKVYRIGSIRGGMPWGHQNFLLPPHTPLLKNLCIAQGCYPFTPHILLSDQRWPPDLGSTSPLTYLSKWEPLSQELGFGHGEMGLYSVLAALLIGMFWPCRSKAEKVVFIKRVGSWKLLMAKGRFLELLLIQLLEFSLCSIICTSTLPVSPLFGFCYLQPMISD